MKKIFVLFIFIIACSAWAKAGGLSLKKIYVTDSGFYFSKVITGLSHYSPGDTVHFTAVLNFPVSNGTLLIKYFHLSNEINNQTIDINQASEINWSWKAPPIDYQGYLVEISLMQGNQILDNETIAVDVSSNWSFFPRYGFLSNYPQLSRDSIHSVVETLNRYHINGIQFYDWQYKHNMPLKGTPDNPAPYWNDIANRTIYFSTVKSYIDEAHKHNMKAMSYNLLYGAYSNAYMDGVNLDDWGLYKDALHQNRFMYTLPSGWASNLYFMDPSNKEWQAYIISQEKKVFEALPFDGWHVDQVGDNGTMYNYQGQKVTVSDTFQDFLQAAKDSLNVDLVMNAVNQYGQSGIAKSPVDFLYSEVWDPNNSFADLVNIILRNGTLGSNKLKSVIAAYVNYNLSNNAGYFNPPGVLLLDAVIFASGGSHIELGEHMLGKEYFPNSNLKMSDELKNQLIHYYDFLVAYENLLRDSVELKQTDIKSDTGIKLSVWPPQQGAVWCLPLVKKDEQVLQLINFVDANSMEWRDANGTQTEPDTIFNVALTVPVTSKVSKIWFASPDFNRCSPAEVQFTEDNSSVSFSIPQLKYWDMVVIEYLNGTTSINESPGKNLSPGNYSLGQNYPNPFNPQTIIPFKMKDSGKAEFKVFNILGKKIFDETFYGSGGENQFIFNGSNLESGIYFYSLTAAGFNQTKKMCLVK